MKLVAFALAGFIGILLILGLMLMGTYNSLVSTREAVDNQWAQIQSQLQRRYDLIPNLVESVKGVLNQEQEIFTEIANARTRYAGAANPAEQVQAANQLESALGRLLVITENYPQLKSSEVMQTFMAQLEGTENRISVERQRYNDTVRDYNLKLKTFPTNLIAGFLGFTERPYFEAPPAAQTAPQVDFSPTQ